MVISLPDYQKIFNETFCSCQKFYQQEVGHTQRGKFNLKPKHYVLRFLTHQEISECINKINNPLELQKFLSELNNFFINNGYNPARSDYSYLFLHNWENINSIVLKEFCIITKISPDDIQLHIFPEIRKKVQIILNLNEFPITNCLTEIYKLHILLNYCKIKTSSYLEKWFKINQPWEGEEALQNPIAQKNLRILLKNLNKSK